MPTRAHTVSRFYLQGFVDPSSEGQAEPYVWHGSLATGEIKRKSPKNISLIRGLYDGPGGFEDANASIEDHLSKIESAAAPAIRQLLDDPAGCGPSVPPEITRFLSWQAARTPGLMDVE